MAKLGEVFPVIRNGASIKQKSGAGGFPITRIETISNRIVNRSKMGYAGIFDIEKYQDYVLQDGDILMSHINSEAHLGKVALYTKQGNEQIIHGMNLLMLRSNSKKLLPEYAKYYFESWSFLRQIQRITKKSVNQASFTVTALKEVEIPCVNIDAQKEIVKRLQNLEQLISLREQQLVKLDELIKARFVEMFGDIIRNDKSWPIHNFSDIASSRLGKMLDAKQQTGKHSYPYLANFNVQWFSFNVDNLNQMDFNEAEQKEFELRDGDLLVCEGGEIGRCAVWHNEIQPCFFQKALHRVRCNRQLVQPDYLAWWFKYNCNHDGFAEIAGAKATIAHLPGIKLKQLQVALPPLSLQNEFAAFVERVDQQKQTVQQSLEKLELMKKALMQEYFG
jgi:type I restriction enzyme S subunit